MLGHRTGTVKRHQVAQWGPQVPSVRMRERASYGGRSKASNVATSAVYGGDHDHRGATVALDAMQPNGGTR